MWSELQTEVGHDVWSGAVVVLADAGVKGLVLLALAGLSAVALRRASAAERHLVWMSALAGLVLLPILSIVAPKWQLPILPSAAPPTEPGERPTSPLPEGVQTVATPVAPLVAEMPRHEAPAPAAVPADTTPEPPTPSVVVLPKRSLRAVAHWMLTAWLAVSLALLAPLLAGLAVVARLRRKAPAFASDSLAALTRDLSAALGLRRPVPLLDAGPMAMPMAAGLIRSAVFLPRCLSGPSRGFARGS